MNLIKVSRGIAGLYFLIWIIGFIFLLRMAEARDLAGDTQGFFMAMITIMFSTLALLIIMDLLDKLEINLKNLK